MDKFLSWGDFITQKRRKNRHTLREVAAKIGISYSYLNEIEKNKKINPSMEIIQKLIHVLCLDNEEISLFYDLHAKANGIVSGDLPEYIMENGIVRKALRTAKNKPATDKDWQRFIDKLK